MKDNILYIVTLIIDCNSEIFDVAIIIMFLIGIYIILSLGGK